MNPDTKTRHRILLFAFSVMMLAALACNAFAGNVEPDEALPPPQVTVAADETAVPPTTAVAEGAPASTATLSGEPTAAEDEAPANDGGTPAVVARVDVNVRTGPGVVYDRDGFLLQGEAVSVLGIDPVSGWWKIQCPPRATGNECWVSGGSEYTEPRNTAGVPAAAVPPTPTPRPTATAVAGDLDLPAGGSETVAARVSEPYLAYRDGDAIWTVSLDLSLSPPLAGEPQQILISPNIRDIFISPDGQKIAYLVGTFDANELRVVNSDGSNGRTLVRSAALPVAGGDAEDVAALIGDVAWLPDSQGLAFNTEVINLVGPGLGEQEDLWTVSLSGGLSQRFPAGTGGGHFALSPTGRLILSQDEAVVRVNLDGSDRETVIDFEFVNTASEYAFYPEVQWAVDGSAAYAAISGPEPFSGDESALWQVPLDGEAELLASLESPVLFDPVVWSPQGLRLAHVATPVDGGGPELVVGDGDGRSLITVAVDNRLAFLGWSPDGEHYLYAGSDYLAVGAVDAAGLAEVVDLPAGETAVDAAWLTDDGYLAVVGRNSAWTLQTGNVTGETETLVGINSSLFDVYVP